MSDSTKYVVGFLLLLIMASGVVYVSMDTVKLRVDNDKTTFYVLNENSRWEVSGREYFSIFDGTSKMNRRPSDITIETTFDTNSNVTTIIRTTPYIRGPIVEDIYTFDGNVKDVELFPISHHINVKNASDYFFRYEIRELDYDGETRKLTDETEFSFGQNMKVSFEDGYRWGWIYKAGIVKVQYDIKSGEEIFNVRLYDPPADPGTFYKLENTIYCEDATIGDWEVVDSINYTAVDNSFTDLPEGNYTRACTTHVTDMNSLFELESTFNQNISSWDTSNVTKMDSMFRSTFFNQSIGNWDTSKVTNMSRMFNRADDFNQDISSWCVSLIASEPADFSTDCPLTELNKPVWGTCPSSIETIVEYTCDRTKNQYRVSSLTEQDVEPTGQNESCPAYNITNTGTLNGTALQVRLNNSLPEGIEMECTTNNSGVSLCYQEFANISNACGGLATGNYGYNGTFTNVENIYDGQWDTFGAISSSYGNNFINYTIPEGATRSSKILIKTDVSGPLNITIPDVCWEAVGDDDILQFRVRWDNYNIFASLYCYKDAGAFWGQTYGDNWANIYGPNNVHGWYEEAMWWNISKSYADNTFINLTTYQQEIYTETIEPDDSVSVYCRIDLDNPENGRIGQVLFEVTE